MGDKCVGSGVDSGDNHNQGLDSQMTQGVEWIGKFQRWSDEEKSYLVGQVKGLVILTSQVCSHRGMTKRQLSYFLGSKENTGSKKSTGFWQGYAAFRKFPGLKMVVKLAEFTGFDLNLLKRKEYR